MKTSTQCALLGTLFLVACGSSKGAALQDSQNDASLDISLGDFGTFANDGIANNDTNFSSDASCASTSETAQLMPLDIFLLIDTSGSMAYSSKWISEQSAINTIITSPSFAGIGLALEFFPVQAVCDPSSYGQPVIPFAPIPSQNAEITAAIDRQKPNGGTPLVPVFEGAYPYAKQWAKAYPTHKTIVVLATDGEPDTTCENPTFDGGLGNSLANAVSLTEAAAASAPEIDTFVIGVGSDLTPLNAIAAAGNTTQAILVDTTSDITGQLTTAFTQVRTQALGCTYAVPTNDAGLTNFSMVNVRLCTNPTSSTNCSNETDFYYVASASQCALTPYGYYYDNVTNPTQILLCSAPCSQVQQLTNARVDIQFGCQRRIIVPT